MVVFLLQATLAVACVDKACWYLNMLNEISFCKDNTPRNQVQVTYRKKDLKLSCFVHMMCGSLNFYVIYLFISHIFPGGPILCQIPEAE